MVGRMEVNYYTRIKSDYVRSLMFKMIEAANEQGKDYVPQSWARNAEYHDRPVSMRLITALTRAGMIKTEFEGGPVFRILQWHDGSEESGQSNK